MTDTVRIMSYNTALFNNLLDIGDLNLLESAAIGNDEKRMKKIIKILNGDSNPNDIICLCEVWSDRTKEEIVHKLSGKYRYNHYYKQDFLKFGGGILVLSKKPIYNPVYQPFARLADLTVDKIAGKGYLILTILWSKTKQFRLIFAHTQSGKTHTNERCSNLLQMSYDLDEAYHPGTPAIVLGDFNVYADETYCPSEVVDKLKLAGRQEFKIEKYGSDQNIILGGIIDGFDVGADIDPKETPKSTCVNSDDRLDYIFMSDDWKTKSYDVIDSWVTDDNEPCSDHYPIQAEMELVTEKIISKDIFRNHHLALEKANEYYGNYKGVLSNRIVISNLTDKYLLRFEDSHCWKGEFQIWPSPIIGPGEVTPCFYVHPHRSLVRAKGCLIYRVYDEKDKPVADLFLGFRTPYNRTNRNKVYVEVREIGHWWKAGSKSHMNYLIDHKGEYKSDDYHHSPVRVSGGIDSPMSSTTDFAVILP